MITMFDLAGADPALRFSPYCWRTRLALQHKRLPFDAVAWRFTDTDALPAGCKQVPSIVDDGRVVTDSWAIAEYLEQRYPDQPSLFGGPRGQAHARFFSIWSDQLNPAIARMVVADIDAVLAEQDRAYFRTTREARFGMTLGQAQADRADRVEAFRARLAPLRAVLAHQAFLGGSTPDYADYCAVSGLQWAASVSDFALLADGDAVLDWHRRVVAPG